MKTLRLILLLSFFICLFGFQSGADVKLPRIFSSNMVLQQGIEIPVWGWAKPGEKVAASLNGTTVSTKAGKDGKWKVRLPSQKYGGPFTLSVKGHNLILFENVMIGEVWVCSGQSNMEMAVKQCKNAEAEINDANYPQIRLFTVPKTVAQFPQDDISSGEWEECSPQSVAKFSAVGYFFGRELYKELNVPVGLIHTSWGGTVAETWTSPSAIKNDPDFSSMLAELQQIDINRYQEEKRKKIKNILGGEIPDEDSGFNDGKPVWAASGFDDSTWKTINVPDIWENQGYTDIDGIAWYRKEFSLTAEQAKSNLSIHLGRIDDSDITWLNGVEIGQTGQWNNDRIYTADARYLKPGKNILAVRVNDTGGNGGIYGDPKDLYIAAGGQKIDIAGNWKFKISKATIGSTTLGPNSYPTLLFNGMLNPIIPYGIKGAIWYQGESNDSRAQQYRRIFPQMINDWRGHWGEGDFPFLFVSLANFMQPPKQPGESNWAELREAQAKTLSLPNTGMALAIDIGEANDIHPKNKQDVGKRLALNGLKIAYGKNIVNAGPTFQSVEFKGGKAILTFSETAGGLEASDKYGYVKGFAIAGADKKFYWAQATITGKNKVIVSSTEVPDPVSVRYGWADNPDDVNLYNSSGLPAVPFRTDNWPGITK